MPKSTRNEHQVKMGTDDPKMGPGAQENVTSEWDEHAQEMVTD